MLSYFDFNEVFYSWKNINKMLKASERVSPKMYGEMLQKKKVNKKNRGRQK